MRGSRAALGPGIGLLLLALPLSAALELLRLDEVADWRLDNGLGHGNVSVSGFRLPATVLEVLHTAGVVGDPLYRYNELEQRWAAHDNWTLSLEFDVPPALLSHAAVLLRLDVAGIVLNGVLVGNPANAHRSHAWEVKPLLQPGANQLTVVLLAAPRYAAEQREAYPYAVPATQQVGSIPSYNFIRKAASDFGWDWGPAFAPAGISGGVSLLGRSSAVLTGMAVRQQHLANGSVQLQVDGLLLPLPPSEAPNAQAPAGASLEQGRLLVEVSSPDGLQTWQAEAAVAVPAATPDGGSSCPGSDGGSSNGFRPWLLPEGCDVGAAGQQAGAAAAAAAPAVKRTVGLTLHAPQLWWPHDFGQQPLYSLSLTYALDQPVSGLNAELSMRSSTLPAPAAEAGAAADPSGSAAPAAEGTAAEASGQAAGVQPSAQVKSSMLTRRIGLRTVELVTDALPLGGGETFYFRVNSQPVYARGANIVPAHVFEPSATAPRLRQLVADAKAAHMNMLRVWGGGRYFKDAFYDACDEMGVLVWQEAMFACAMYPRDDAFLMEAWLEVREQAGRLSCHPSVAIWGGGNENEAAFGWFPEPQLNPWLYAADYTKLFVDVVRQAVRSVDPVVPYVDNSPSNGLLSREPYVKRWGDVTDPRFGDVHFYDYRSDAWAAATYPPTKFVSEFGFMSLPSLAAYKRVSEPEDWQLGAPLTGFRMRHAGGLEELAAQMQLHFFNQPLQLQPQQAAAAAADGTPAPAAQRPGAGTGDVAQQAAQPGGAPTARQQEQAWEEQSMQQRLGRLAAAEATLAAAFNQAAAAGGDTAAVVHDAVASGALSLNASAAAAAPPVAAATGPGTEPGPEQARSPEAALAREQQRFAAFTYLSQLQQALAYQAAVHQWRRNKADPAALTMGVLYWQLNDVWQGPSWSGINSDGSWRLAHHAAAEFFRPVLVSGVRDGTGSSVEVHLTNDLPVDVTGILTVEAVPYAATRAEQVALVYSSDQAGIRAFDSRPVWLGSVSRDVLAAIGQLPAGTAAAPADGSTRATRPADVADVFLRLRFCPTAVDTHVAAAGQAASPNPFAPNAAAGPRPVLLDNGAAAARDAAVSDGAASCDAPVQPPLGANHEQCAAAQRLLQCSESLMLLTEPKAARMAPATVSAALAGPNAGAQPRSAAADAADASPPLAITLTSDAVALFVAVENEEEVGRFNASGMLLLLPWQPQTLEFYAAAPAVKAAAGNDRLHAQAARPPVPQSEAEAPRPRGKRLPRLSIYWLLKGMNSLELLATAGVPPPPPASAALAPSAWAACLLLLPLAAACVAQIM